MDLQAFRVDCENPNRSDDKLKRTILQASQHDDLPDSQLAELVLIISRSPRRMHLLEAVLRPILRPHSPIV